MPTSSNAPPPLDPSSVPGPDATLEEINTFAHAVDGYGLAGSLEQCAKIHARLGTRHRSGKALRATLNELRCALFFDHRAHRHAGTEPDESGVAFLRALVAAIREAAASQPLAASVDQIHATFREKLLEHVFVSELLQEAWFRHGRTIEVLRAEVDSEGYDLVVEFDGILRHVQLKASHAEAKTARQAISIKLAKKPNGCVVWIIYRKRPGVGRVELRYRFFGGMPGAGLPPLGGVVAKHAKGDANGVKKLKPGFRVLTKNAFSAEMSLSELFFQLFRASNSTVPSRD